MTPLEIDILLWYHTRCVDYREGDFSAPAVRGSMAAFRDHYRLLEPNPEGARVDGDYRTYRLTPRGEAYVSALTAMPLPVCHWVIPTSSSDGTKVSH